MAASPALDRLPEELISNIAARLGPDDIFNFRLTCRTVENRSLHEFATEYFTAKGFLFTTDSLKVLVNIAHNVKLNKYLRDVSFCAGYFSDPVWKCPHDCSCWIPNVREAEAHKEYYNDQQKLIKTGGAKDYIVEAFKKLPALTDLSITDSYSCLPSSVDIRGFRRITRLTGHPPTLAPGDDRKNTAYITFLSHVWRTTIESVAVSGIDTLLSLDTNLKCKRHGLFAKDLNFNKDESLALRKAFTNVKNLRIYLKGRQLSPNAKQPLKGAEARAMVKSFSSLFPNLKDLEYSSDGEKYSGSLLSAVIVGLDLTKLQTFKVHSVAMKEPTILKTLSTMHDAKKVEFTWVDLTSGSWLPILKGLQKLKQLDHLHLMYCQEAGQKAYFLTQPDPHDAENMADDDDGFGMEDDFTDEDDPMMPSLVDPTTGEPAPEFDGLGSDPSPFDMNLTQHERRMIDPNPAHNDLPLHMAPGCEDAGEIGYFVCIAHQSEIQRQLAVFVKEYNVGMPAGTDLDPFAPGGLFGGPMPPGVFGPPPPAPPAPGAAAGQQALNGLLNQLAGAFAPGGPHTHPPHPPNNQPHPNGTQPNTNTPNPSIAHGNNTAPQPPNTANTTTNPLAPPAPSFTQGTMPNGNPYLSASFPANWLQANPTPGGTGNTLGLNGGGAGGFHAHHHHGGGQNSASQNGGGQNGSAATTTAATGNGPANAPATGSLAATSGAENEDAWVDDEAPSDDQDHDADMASPPPGNGECAPS
ncbi:hypothetical protein MBLNU230_g2410t1 [Neophaeotheca triangularis]